MGWRTRTGLGPGYADRERSDTDASDAGVAGYEDSMIAIATYTAAAPAVDGGG
ncbi:MAG: hypothetical protein ACLP1X_03820 [Polyangiaceae bacterium]|jgi:hypothetical protein